MAMALIESRVRRQAIQIALALRIPDPHTFTARQSYVERLVIARTESSFDGL
jgi:hypothetical protein